jgi:hypothetical protein
VLLADALFKSEEPKLPVLPLFLPSELIGTTPSEARIFGACTTLPHHFLAQQGIDPAAVPLVNSTTGPGRTFVARSGTSADEGTTASPSAGSLGRMHARAHVRELPAALRSLSPPEVWPPASAFGFGSFIGRRSTSQQQGRQLAAEDAVARCPKLDEPPGVQDDSLALYGFLASGTGVTKQLDRTDM